MKRWTEDSSGWLGCGKKVQRVDESFCVATCLLFSACFLHWSILLCCLLHFSVEGQLNANKQEVISLVFMTASHNVDIEWPNISRESLVKWLLHLWKQRLEMFGYRQHQSPLGFVLNVFSLWFQMPYEFSAQTPASFSAPWHYAHTHSYARTFHHMREDGPGEINY